MSEYVLVGSYQYAPQIDEWRGMVCKQQGNEITVLTVGAEKTEFLIAQWVKDTIALMRSSGQLDVQAPDMHGGEIEALSRVRR